MALSAPDCIFYLHTASLGEKLFQLVIVHAEGQVANKDAVPRSLGSRHLLGNFCGHGNWAGQGGVRGDGTDCWMDGWMAGAVDASPTGATAKPTKVNPGALVTSVGRHWPLAGARTRTRGQSHYKVFVSALIWWSIN